MSQLADFYRDKIIFATGFTGALGIASAWKLLKDTKVKRIFALTRVQDGQCPQERLEKCWAQHIPLSARSMKLDSRVVAIPGDITAGPLLGMDERTVDMLRETVDIVLHFSADINLKKTAKQLAETNVLGTLAVAELLTSFQRLERFGFASTLYSNSHMAEFDEEIYPMLGPEEELAALLGGKPMVDTEPFSSEYSYTKHLVERLLAQRYPSLPTCILRPSCFAPALREPEPLWTLASSMPTVGYIAMVAAQRDRRPMVHASQFDTRINFFDELPVDIIVNMSLAHVAAGTLGPVHINSIANPCTMGDIFEPCLDVMPPQVWKRMPVSAMTGLPRLFKIGGLEHPRGSDFKTQLLIASMSDADLEVFPIDVAALDLKSWHLEKGRWLRHKILKQREASLGVGSARL